LLLLGALAAVACKPDLQGRPSLVDVPRVIAIRSQAAEARPADTVNYDVLVAQPIGDTRAPIFDWALCSVRKPLAESGAIAQVCLQPTAAELVALGAAPSVSSQIPKNVCEVFGPLPPVQKAGEPAVRPEDPDTTGGYYQPVRLLTRTIDAGEEYEVGVTRLACGLALGASQENTIHYGAKYLPNANPSVDSITMKWGDAEPTSIDVAAGASALSVPASVKLELQVDWADCPALPAGDLQQPPYDKDHQQAEALACPGAEAYLYYDTTQQAIIQRREAIRVSWYATDGSFEFDRTGRTEQEATTPRTRNTWTAPDAATTVRFWLVIRDDRRGVGWVSFDLAIVK
jgi:hypothetical protein